MIRNYLRSYLYLFGIIILGTIILTIINYFVKLPVYMIKIIIPILAMFIASIILGRHTKEKAYIEGLKFSLLYLVFITIIKLIMKSNFNYKVFIIYITLIVVSMVGGMMGINIKNK